MSEDLYAIEPATSRELRSLFEDSCGVTTDIQGTINGRLWRGWQTVALWPDQEDVENGVVQNVWRRFAVTGVRVFQGPAVEYPGYSDPIENIDWIKKNCQRLLCPVYAIRGLQAVEIVQLVQAGPNCFWDNGVGEWEAIYEPLQSLHDVKEYEITWATPRSIHASFYTPVTNVESHEIATRLLIVNEDAMINLGDELMSNATSGVYATQSEARERLLASVQEYVQTRGGFRLHFT